MSWIQLSLEIAEHEAELASDLFSEAGAVSVSFEDAGNQPLFQVGIDEVGLWQSVKVIGLFATEVDVDAVELLLSSQLEGINSFNWQHEQLDDQVWEVAWKDHFKPMRFGERLWVCPTNAEIPSADALCIRMEPGLAFGTGTHPTTALCLEWLDGQHLQSKTVIDFGCGSGVLGIAAALLGAEHVWAVDVDPDAVDACNENAHKNSVSSMIDVCLAKDFQTDKVDLVLANILANPLIELKPTLTNMIVSQGKLVLSGILENQADMIIQEYESDFRFGEVAEVDGWVRLVGTKC